MLENPCILSWDGRITSPIRPPSGNRAIAARPMDPRQTAHLSGCAGRNRLCRARRAHGRHVTIQRAQATASVARHALCSGMGSRAAPPCPAVARSLCRHARAAVASHNRRLTGATVMRRGALWSGTGAAEARMCRVTVAPLSHIWRITAAPRSQPCRVTVPHAAHRPETAAISSCSSDGRCLRR